MEVEYNLYKSLGNKTDGTFKVPSYSPLSLKHPGWDNVLDFAEKGKRIYYSENKNGDYKFGTSGIVDYVHPKGEYVIVVVDTPIDSWFTILQPLYDCIGSSAQGLVDEMEAETNKRREAFKGILK